MQRCVIVGGAGINACDRIKKLLSPEDFVICCDSGLKHRAALGITPDLIVGDFDSHPNPDLEAETIVLPCQKDDTDTVFGVKEALRRGFEEFLLIGVVGERLDHSLGNVSILLYLDSLGKKATLADDYSLMEIVSKKPVYVGGEFSFFSLLNISGTARDITIENAEYPLNGGEITCEYQYGISNRVLPGKTAKVTVGKGRLLAVKVF